jgi:hypothetical protein
MSKEGRVTYVNRFNKGGFSLWWSLRWLEAIFCAWAAAALLGFFLQSKRFSELGNMLSDIFLCTVLLTVAAEGVLRVFRRGKSCDQSST